MVPCLVTLIDLWMRCAGLSSSEILVGHHCTYCSQVLRWVMRAVYCTTVMLFWVLGLCMFHRSPVVFTNLQPCSVYVVCVISSVQNRVEIVASHVKWRNFCLERSGIYVSKISLGGQGHTLLNRRHSLTELHDGQIIRLVSSVSHVGN